MSQSILLNYHLNDAFSFIIAAASKLLINSVYDDFLEICAVSLPQWFCEKKINIIQKDKKLYKKGIFYIKIIVIILFQN